MNCDKSKISSLQGFTRTEFLITIVIIALIVLVITPAMRHAKQPSYRVKEMSNLRQIGVALLAYAYDHKETLPTHPQAIEPYLPEGFSSLFESAYPDVEPPLDYGTPKGSSVRYGCFVFMNLGTKLEDIEEPGDAVLGYAAKVSPKQKQRSVLFLDGHVQSFTEDELSKVLNLTTDTDAVVTP